MAFHMVGHCIHFHGSQGLFDLQLDITIRFEEHIRVFPFGQEHLGQSFDQGFVITVVQGVFAWGCVAVCAQVMQISHNRQEADAFRLKGFGW